MTREETLVILSVLRGAYPQFYRDATKKDALDTVNLWAEMFAEDDPALVGAAVKTLIATDEKGFPPHVGAVKAKMRRLMQPQEMTEAEAWRLVYKAICRGIWNSREEFDKLPEELQRLVGAPSQLRDWAVMDADVVQSVVASNFQRSYRARAASRRELAMMPGQVREMLQQVAGGMSLDEKARKADAGHVRREMAWMDEFLQEETGGEKG